MTELVDRAEQARDIIEEKMVEFHSEKIAEWITEGLVIDIIDLIQHELECFEGDNDLKEEQIEAVNSFYRTAMLSLIDNYELDVGNSIDSEANYRLYA